MKKIKDEDVKPGMIVQMDGKRYEVLRVRGAEKVLLEIGDVKPPTENEIAALCGGKKAARRLV